MLQLDRTKQKIKGFHYRKIIPFILLNIILLLGAVSVKAQNNSNSIGIPVKAKLINGLTVTSERNLRFGTIVQGTGKVKIKATDINSGLFLIQGRSNSEVYCNLTPPKALVDGKGHSIPFTAYASFNNKKQDPTTAIQFQKASGAVQGFDLNANPKHSESEAYIWIYGTINVRDVKPGNYTGIFTLSVSY